MQVENENSMANVWRAPFVYWAVLASCALLLSLIFMGGLGYMVHIWNTQEEYSHGFLIPLISLFFICQKKDELERNDYSGSWVGLLVLLLGMGLYFIGELSTLYIIIQYAFLLALYGFLLALLGWQGFKKIWEPLLLLVFMIPLPIFLYRGLSANLQLISTELGVWFIRLFDIAVYVEGNVIDLGVYKLQVVEACSGLRYIFPLMTLGFIAAYLYKAALWKRLVVFISTIPITVLMNSFRIGAIGVLVEYGGKSMAEGFLHDFEGWVVFMACTLILVLEMWALTKIGDENRPLSEVFGLYFPAPTPKHATVHLRKIPRPVLASGAVLAIALAFSTSMEKRSEVIPPRTTFIDFPMNVGEWRGKPERLEQIYLDALKLDDYIIADFVGRENEGVNFYVAYYASQSKGESAHSPRSCIPGGGWLIEEITQRKLDGVTVGGMPLEVNRLVIGKGDGQQLVYYWFQGRNRIITNEYMVKWFLFWDSLTRHRTDGALVRLTTPVMPGVDITQADRRLESFARDISGYLPEYIPE